MSKKTENGFFTMIGEGTFFEGVMAVPHSLRIDGTFKGKIEIAEDLLIGSNAVVEADLKAKSATIGGKVHGNLIADERVVLQKNGSLVGDLRTRDLVINEGAFFHGRCSMKET